MPKKEISPEQKLRFEEIRASMAIEGYQVSDETLEKAIAEYESNPLSGRFAELKEKADREGKDFAEVVRDEFCPDLKFEPDEDA